MTCENHPLRTTEIRGGDQRIAMTMHGQVRLHRQERLNGIGQRTFVITDGIAAHDLFHQRVQCGLLAGGGIESNLKFTHASHYPPDRPISRHRNTAFEMNRRISPAQCHTDDWLD